MNKVKKLLAAALVVFTIVLVGALPASATSTKYSGTNLSGAVFNVTTNEPYFKLWYYYSGTTTVTPTFLPVSKSLTVPKTMSVNGNQRLYYRLSSVAQSVAITYSPSGVSGSYAIRRATTLKECGEW